MHCISVKRIFILIHIFYRLEKVYRGSTKELSVSMIKERGFQAESQFIIIFYIISIPSSKHEQLKRGFLKNVNLDNL